MKTSKKEVIVKGYGNKKHTFEIEHTSISGYEFMTFKKNGNPILRCTPNEFTKLRNIFCK